MSEQGCVVLPGYLLYFLLFSLVEAHLYQLRVLQHTIFTRLVCTYAGCSPLHANTGKKTARKFMNNKRFASNLV
jgi:hypothetical protein